MKAILEIHILQNFAPANLNRDDTGSPKDAYFGGTRRGRISSQSLKRAMRVYFREQQLLPASHLGLRTKRLTERLAGQLASLGHPQDQATQVINLALGGLKLTVDETDGKTQYLVFFGQQELEAITQLIHENWDALTAALPKDGTAKKKDKKAAKDAVPDALVKALSKVLDGGKAVDVALFGRMLADLPEKNQYAAAQVAHAISTHKIEHNEDFYTAVDDLKPDDNSGADMLGTVEFNSACYYRYAVVDLQKLGQNLHCLDEAGQPQGNEDTDLLLSSVAAFLRASIFALPTGKQNSFAAHQLPSFVALTVRREASPRSLTNAFERAVRPSSEGWLAASAQALIHEWNHLEEAYGQGGFSAALNLTAAPLSGVLEGHQVANTELLIEQTLQQVRQALGA